MKLETIHYASARSKPTPTQESKSFIHDTLPSVGYTKAKPTLKTQVMGAISRIAESQPASKKKEKPFAFLVEGIKKQHEKNKTTTWGRIGINQRW